MILAIDQGSSKTQALIGDDLGNILGVGTGEGACHFLVGMTAAMQAVDHAAYNALAAARLPREAITVVSAGIAGANWPEEYKALTNELQSRFPVARITVYNDCVAALFAGTRNKEAIVLCAGTSFNSAVVHDGQIIFIYNNYIEAMDEGGKGLATRALQGVFRSLTTMGLPTSLTEKALSFFGYKDTLSMLLDFSRNSMSRPIKDFAPCVDEEAMRGDKVALDVQYTFAQSLSRYATAALKRYEMTGSQADVVLSGGVFKARSPVMEDTIRMEIHRVAPLARIVNAEFEPVVGAYVLAFDQEQRGRVWKRVQIESHRLSLTRK